MIDVKKIIEEGFEDESTQEARDELAHAAATDPEVNKALSEHTLMDRMLRSRPTAIGYPVASEFVYRAIRYIERQQGVRRLRLSVLIGFPMLLLTAVLIWLAIPTSSIVTIDFSQPKQPWTHRYVNVATNPHGNGDEKAAILIPMDRPGIGPGTYAWRVLWLQDPAATLNWHPDGTITVDYYVEKSVQTLTMQIEMTNATKWVSLLPTSPGHHSVTTAMSQFMATELGSLAPNGKLLGLSIIGEYENEESETIVEKIVVTVPGR